MISKRLLAISKLVDKNTVVFDVGSDHGKLPIFLVKENIVKKAYAGDNKQGPLNNAIENINFYKLQDKVIPVLADGVPKDIDDIDNIVIAGMGFHTIEHILNNIDINRYKNIIVQSNNDVDLLRKYISEHMYTIVDEVMVYDDFYYQIIKFNKDSHDEYNDIQIKYGPILLKNRDDIFLQYLNHKHDKLIQINKKANKAEIIKEIKEIESILSNRY